jgi:hypothetical protein
MNVSQELIQEAGRQLQDFPIDEKRSAELALEVSRLNSALLQMTGGVDFNDDPAAFRGLLEGGANERG